MLLSSTFRLCLGKQISETNLRSFSVGCIQFDSERSKPPPGGDNKKKQASQKLHSLLQSIIKDDLADSKIAKELPKIEIPRPRSMYEKKKITRKEETKHPKTLGQKIVEAAQEVSKTVKGNRTETEAQLLQKLLYKETTLKDEIVKAAPKSLNLTDILTEMKIEKEESPKRTVAVERTRSDSVKQILRDRKTTKGPPSERMKYYGKSVARVDIFGSRPLGIFKTENVLEEGEDMKLQTWEKCYANELRLNSTQPPTNIYEQMIQWTDRGMLWKFPIDNEQGLDKEKQVDFSEHVFLEVYLEGWCPDRGPVRHFMELVCVGLSRNHWLSASEKKNHILWYKEYFISKKALLKEIGAGEIADEEVGEIEPTAELAALQQ